MNEFKNFMNCTDYEEYTDFTQTIEEEAAGLYETFMYYTMCDICECIDDVNADGLNHIIANLTMGDMLAVIEQYDLNKTNPVIREELVKILKRKLDECSN